MSNRILTHCAAFTSCPSSAIVADAYGKAVDMELSGPFVNKNRELFDLCLSVRKAASETDIDTTEALGKDVTQAGREFVWKRTLLAFSAKADRTFWAVLLLSSKGFSEDAIMLTRSLLESDVSLRYVSVDPHSRVMEMLYEADWETKLELQAMITVRGLDKELKGALADVDNRLSRLERDCGINGNKWKKKSLWKKAKEIGLENHYFVFRRFSGLIHANANKLMSYIRSPEGAVEFFAVDSTPRGENLDKVLVSAAAYFADIVLLRNEAFGLDTSVIVEVHARLREHFEQMKNSARR